MMFSKQTGQMRFDHPMVICLNFLSNEKGIFTKMDKKENKKAPFAQVGRPKLSGHTGQGNFPFHKVQIRVRKT